MRGVAARLADGATVRGAALIGADGLWSNVRRKVTRDGHPRVSGHTTYRSVIPTGEMPPPTIRTSRALMVTRYSLCTEI